MQPGWALVMDRKRHRTEAVPVQGRVSATPLRYLLGTPRGQPGQQEQELPVWPVDGCSLRGAGGTRGSTPTALHLLGPEAGARRIKEQMIQQRCLRKLRELRLQKPTGDSCCPSWRRSSTSGAGRELRSPDRLPWRDAGI